MTIVKSSLSDAIHGSSGHDQKLQHRHKGNDVENLLKKQAAEIDNLKQENAAIKNLRELTSNFTQQTENDISTIQLLQNRVFSLEAELDRPNAFNRTTSSELSSYLSDMNNA